VRTANTALFHYVRIMMQHNNSIRAGMVADLYLFILQRAFTKRLNTGHNPTKNKNKYAGDNATIIFTQPLIKPLRHLPTQYLDSTLDDYSFLNPKKCLLEEELGYVSFRIICLKRAIPAKRIERLRFES
jgi:hypothetical protein